LTETFASGGGGCTPENFSVTLPLQVSSVAPGATTVIRTGAAAGTSRTLCCSARSCNTGTCNFTETYAVKTSAGSRTLSNAVSIAVETPSCLPSCDVPVTWPLTGADVESAAFSRTRRCE
jgi:hypothetical protein